MKGKGRKLMREKVEIIETIITVFVAVLMLAVIITSFIIEIDMLWLLLVPVVTIPIWIYVDCKKEINSYITINLILISFMAVVFPCMIVVAKLILE